MSNLIQLVADDMRGEKPSIEPIPGTRIAGGAARNRHLQLGVPSGSNGYRLFEVRPELAESVIRAHIAQMKAKLAEANECARVELNANL